MKCPKCGSENTQYVAVHHSGSSESFTDACCGMMIFGPIGILCGLCGASPGFTDDYWVCHSCGKKFQAGTAKAAEKARQEKIQQELNAKARRKALLSAANPVILQNIDNEVIEAENRYPQYKMIFFFSGCFCDILIRSRIRPERKYYVTKIICFFQERNCFVNCSDPGASFYVLGQTG